jgi:hypothetical protein
MRDAAAAFLRDVESRPASQQAAMAHRICGITSWYEGNFSEARRSLEQALAIDDSAQHREPTLHFNLDVTSTAMVFLPLVLWPLGLLDHAGSFVEKRCTML